MDYRYLTNDELRYELDIRGVTHELYAEHQDLVNLAYRNRLREEHTGRVNQLNPENELDALKPKVAELRTLFQEARLTRRTSVDNTRLSSLFVHSSYRLRRVQYRGRKELYEELDVVAKSLKTLQMLFAETFTENEFPSFPVPSEEIAELTRMTERMFPTRRADVASANSNREPLRDLAPFSPTPAAHRREDRASEQLSADFAASNEDRRGSRRGGDGQKRSLSGKHQHRRRRSSSTSEETSSDPSDSRATNSARGSRRTSSRRNPVLTWTVRFSGSENLLAFLEEVEELSEEYSTSEGELLTGIGRLLSGNAKSWYRVMKPRISSWATFKTKIREAYLIGERDEDMWDRMRKMRQRGDETFIVYEARVEETYRGLKKKDEDRKLNILIEGLHQYYQPHIRSGRISSLGDLRRECRELEQDKTRLQRLERERERDRVNRDKQERQQEERTTKKDHRKTWNVAALEEAQPEKRKEGQADLSVDAVNFTPRKGGMQCWRCGKVGEHLSMQCKEELHCISCGERGVIAERCPRCARAGDRRTWTEPANFQQGAWSWGSQAPLRFPYPPPPLPQQVENPYLNRQPQPTASVDVMHSSPEDPTPALRPQGAPRTQPVERSQRF